MTTTATAAATPAANPIVRAVLARLHPIPLDLGLGDLVRFIRDLRHQLVALNYGRLVELDFDAWRWAEASGSSASQWT
jgi:hypothetical protein